MTTTNKTPVTITVAGDESAAVAMIRQELTHIGITGIEPPAPPRPGSAE